VELVIRALKEEQIWPNAYETWREAQATIEACVAYYNPQRVRSALGYLTPDEFATTHFTLTAA
jgi:transposase InsO family protein